MNGSTLLPKCKESLSQGLSVFQGRHPGVFLEDGAEVDLAIKTKAGRFEIAMFPSEEAQQAERHEVKDCGISEEEIMRVCSFAIVFLLSALR